MRWEALFRDLEAQLDAAESADVAAEVADRTRAEAGRLRLVDRLRPTVGGVVSLLVAGGERVDGRVTAVGAEWVLVAETPAREALVPVRAILAVRGLSARSAHPGGISAVESRLRIGHALRQVARDRARTRVTLVDGSVVTGTLDRVGRDFVEVTERAPDVMGSPVQTVAVATDAIAVVRTT